jgi:glycosyltransferase involved in cell wall biosynthesis
LDIDASDPEMWNDLGALSFHTNDIDSAERYFLQAMVNDKHYPLPYMNLMDLYLQENRIKDAKRISEDYLKTFPDDPVGLKYFGILSRLDGNFHEAIRYLSMAKQIAKEDADIPYNLGLAFMSTGDYESSTKAFRNTLAIDPQHRAAKDKLVACYCKLEGANSAFRLLKKHIPDVSWKTARKMAKRRDKEGINLSIVVPAFNEADRILTNTRKVQRWMTGLGRHFEIIVVDDGSDDDTYEILEMLSRNIKEVRPYKSKTNKGKGMALREAALKARGDLVIFLDADLELHPSLIGKMIRQMEEAGADVVLGSKRHPDSEVNYPWHRKVLSNIYYMVNRMLFGIPVKDTQTGIKVFKKAVLDDVIPRLIEKQYAFDLELIVNVHALGYKMIEAPIRLNYSRTFGRIGGRAFLRTGIDTLAIFYRLKILKYYERKRLPLLEYPKVSIVIPFKEFGTYAKQCLKHCLELDYPEFEIILLPDDWTEVQPDPRIKVIPTGPAGPSEKRDQGVREATGEIVAFIDDDAYPPAEWLRKVVRNFSDKQVAAVGGPGVTAEEDNFWQQLSGSIFSSIFVSGSYIYRYVPGTFKETQDLPTCNLAVRKKHFERVGGFDTNYWPGEDTILCLKITKDLKKKIVYDPDAWVHHHRRELFGPHLKQVKSYALHRGFFARKFPETSRKLTYFLPSFFVFFLMTGLWLSSYSPTFRLGYLVSIGVYLCLISFARLFTFNPAKILLVTSGIFLTHVTYGIFFIKGLMARTLSH